MRHTQVQPMLNCMHAPVIRLTQGSARKEGLAPGTRHGTRACARGNHMHHTRRFALEEGWSAYISGMLHSDQQRWMEHSTCLARLSAP